MRVVFWIVVLCAVGVMFFRQIDTIRATVYIDKKGHYILKDYTIDENGCLDFIDFVGQRIYVCGGYRLVTEDEYRQEHINDLPPLTF